MIIRILVVEADAGSRDNYQQLFTRARHFDTPPEFTVVEDVAKAADALKAAKEKGEPIHVVIADSFGMELARWIWARRYPARIVLISTIPEADFKAQHKDYTELRNNRVIFGCMDKIKSMAAAISDMVTLAATTPANTLRS